MPRVKMLACQNEPVICNLCGFVLRRWHLEHHWRTSNKHRRRRRRYLPQEDKQRQVEEAEAQERQREAERQR